MRSWITSTFAPRLQLISGKVSAQQTVGRPTKLAAHLHHPVDGGEVEAAGGDVGGEEHHGLGLTKLVEHCGLGGANRCAGLVGAGSAEKPLRYPCDSHAALVTMFQAQLPAPHSM